VTQERKLDGARKDVDELLRDEVGTAVESLGGGLAGRVARHLGTNRFEIAADVHLGIGEAHALYVKAVKRAGRLIHTETDLHGESITAVVGAGFLNMNPAVVEIELRDAGADSCSVVLRGTAKEGLLKQHAGEGAVRTLLAAVHRIAPGSTIVTDPERR
jgi:hypothetical protein